MNKCIIFNFEKSIKLILNYVFSFLSLYIVEYLYIRCFFITETLMKYKSITATLDALKTQFKTFIFNNVRRL